MILFQKASLQLPWTKCRNPQNNSVQDEVCARQTDRQTEGRAPR